MACVCFFLCVPEDDLWSALMVSANTVTALSTISDRGMAFSSLNAARPILYSSATSRIILVCMVPDICVMNDDRTIAIDKKGEKWRGLIQALQNGKPCFFLSHLSRSFHVKHTAWKRKSLKNLSDKRHDQRFLKFLKLKLSASPPFEWRDEVGHARFSETRAVKLRAAALSLLPCQFKYLHMHAV